METLLIFLDVLTGLYFAAKLAQVGISSRYFMRALFAVARARKALPNSGGKPKTEPAPIPDTNSIFDDDEHESAN